MVGQFQFSVMSLCKLSYLDSRNNINLDKKGSTHSRQIDLLPYRVNFRYRFFLLPDLSLVRTLFFVPPYFFLGESGLVEMVMSKEKNLGAHKG